MAQHVLNVQGKRRGQAADDGHARGQIRVFYFVFAQVLFDEQQRVRLYKKFRGAQLRRFDKREF